MKIYGLIGFPLSHSFSKKYFTDKFLLEGLTDVRYENFPLEHINDLRLLLKMHPGLSGLNVTIPYKKEVIPYLHRSFLPAGVPACNCIRIVDGELWGYNTDHIGFENSVRPLLNARHSHALILGTGGSSMAVKYVLDRMNIEAVLISRNPGGEFHSYSELDEEMMSKCKLIVNTTPVGMYPADDDFPPIPYHYLTPEHILFDLIYNPEKTVFLKKGEERGARIKNGREMLEIQAEASWKIWNESQ